MDIHCKMMATISLVNISHLICKQKKYIFFHCDENTVIFVYNHETYINPYEAVITVPVTENTFDKVSYYYI